MISTSKRFLTPAERRARVLRLIRQTGMSPWKFSKHAGIHYVVLRRLLESVEDPPVSSIIRLAEALGVSAGFLIDRKEVR